MNGENVAKVYRLCRKREIDRERKWRKSKRRRDIRNVVHLVDFEEAESRENSPAWLSDGADKRKWENGAKHINSDGFKKAPLPLRWRGFAQSASELSCVPLKRRNGNGAILKASEFDCAEGGGK